MIAWTEGNDSTSTTVQRLSQWYKGLYYFQEDGSVAAAASLVFDPTLDSSIRGAFSSGISVWFQGLADGIVNTTFKDQNDYNILKQNLKAALVGGGWKDCYGLDAVGNCTDWR